MLISTRIETEADFWNGQKEAQFPCGHIIKLYNSDGLVVHLDHETKYMRICGVCLVEKLPALLKAAGIGFLEREVG